MIIEYIKYRDPGGRVVRKGINNIADASLITYSDLERIKQDIIDKTSQDLYDNMIKTTYRELQRVGNILQNQSIQDDPSA